jgi:hypothetical protein
MFGSRRRQRLSCSRIIESAPSSSIHGRTDQCASRVHGAAGIGVAAAGNVITWSASSRMPIFSPIA